MSAGTANRRITTTNRRMITMKKEIFTLTFPEGILFTDILFNSSYRKIIDSDIRSNNLYKELYQLEGISFTLHKVGSIAKECFEHKENLSL